MSLYESFCDNAFPRGYRQDAPVSVVLWTVQAFGGGFAQARHHALDAMVTVYAPAQNRVAFTRDDGLAAADVPLRVVLALLDRAGFRVGGYRGRRTAPSSTAHTFVDGWVVGRTALVAGALRPAGGRGDELAVLGGDLFVRVLAERPHEAPPLVDARYSLEAVVATLVASGWEIAPR